jgi:hypothetical protein
MQAAQASNDVPARYDPVRLRRPTTPLPGRGRPIGLGADLSVTAAGPATEGTSVAAGAPARTVTALPTSLHPSLRRLADGSRPPTPEGSLPGFPWGLQPLSGPLQAGLRLLPPPLPAALSAHLTMRFPLREGYGLTTFRRRNHRAWCRLRRNAGGTSFAPDEFGASGPAHMPFGPSGSAACACPL